jgi:hypothetical protein
VDTLPSVDGDDLERDPPDDRPPICPACGVTMGLEVGADGEVSHLCQECGFPGQEA